MAAYFSSLDHNIPINQEYWAVTMICDSNSSGEAATSSFVSNHAILAIEGVEKSGEVFHKYIHLMGPASILNQAQMSKNAEFHKNKSPFLGSGCACGMQRIGQVEIKTIKGNYRHTHKSETWLRSADKVLKMINEAEQEQNNPAAFPRPFAILGSKSIFTTDLSTFKITDPLVVAIAHCDEKLFLYLYDIVKKCRDNYRGIMCGPALDQRGIERLKDHYFYPGSIFLNFGFDVVNDTIVSLSWNEKSHDISFSAWLSEACMDPKERPFTWHTYLSEKRLGEIKTLFYETRTPEDRKKLIANAPEDQKEFFIIVTNMIEKKLEKYTNTVLSFSSRIQKLANKISHDYPKLTERVNELVSNFNNDPLKTYRDLLYTIYENTDLRPIRPDSCFTWAQEKLALIDVEMEKKWFEPILSPTKCYIQPIHERKWSCLSCNTHK